MVYLDTSILAAYYCPEALSAKAERAILRSDRVAVSMLVEVEFYSALARKRRDGSLSVADAHRLRTQFRLHLDTGCYERLALRTEHYEVAREWIGQFATPLRTLDALHLAVSFAANIPILTADAALAEAARYFRVPFVVIGLG